MSFRAFGDERAVERYNDARQISELSENNARLENIKVELENANAELMATCAELTRKKTSELEQKSGRKAVVRPPQGPPPTVPLPPTPQGSFAVNGAVHADDVRGSIKLTVSSEQEQGGAKRQSESSEMLNEAGAQAVYDAAVAERDGLESEMEREREKIKEIVNWKKSWGEIESLTDRDDAVGGQA